MRSRIKDSTSGGLSFCAKNSSVTLRHAVLDATSDAAMIGWELQILDRSCQKVIGHKKANHRLGSKGVVHGTVFIAPEKRKEKTVLERAASGARRIQTNAYLNRIISGHKASNP